MQKALEVGQVAVVENGGRSVVVRIETVDDNIKNGRPGWDGTIIEGSDKGRGVWGYDYQVRYIR